MLMSNPESKALPNAMEEIPFISNIKSKLQFFERLAAPASSKSNSKAVNVTPPGMESVKSRLQAFEELRMVSSNKTRQSTPIDFFSDIPSLKSRMKALQGFNATLPNDVHLSNGAIDFENKTLTVHSEIEDGMEHPQIIITKLPMLSIAERYSRSIASGQIVMGDHVAGGNARTDVGSNGGGQIARINPMTTIKNGSVKNKVKLFDA